ncbi:MAG: hypothetical protein KatS3mg115_2489 [Candidatus Poribacteria bacterium]|nr:MAG: hypothetical protein KatS3mg115_2489 [Candidatus Poribacteria bacterium]
MVNRHGVPIEFRYTDPVRATPEQEVLYGEQRLREAIVLTLGASLWKSLQTKPAILLVEDPGADRLWKTLSARQSLCVAQVEALPTAATPCEGALMVPLDASGNRFGQVRSSDPAQTERAAEALRRLSETMRVDEPFERIERLLQMIHSLPNSERRAQTPMGLGEATPPVGKVRPEEAVLARRARSPEEGRALMAQFVRAKKSQTQELRATPGEDLHPTDAQETPRFRSVEEHREVLRRVLGQRSSRGRMAWWESSRNPSPRRPE